MQKLRDLFGKDLWKRLWKVFLIVLGAFIYGFAFQGFLFPNARGSDGKILSMT